MSYTNSTLVSHTNLSPNHSGLRTHSIDRITPHCVVGQCSVETLGNIFAPISRQASSNYGIGKDGRVGMYCEEKNRSWCTSSSANDQRAITIECASDTTEPYAMNETVYATLIELCVDICKRNGKAKLLWFGDKDKTLNYKPASDEMVLTVHRWFANKSCPGNWLYSRLGDLAEKVTSKLSTLVKEELAYYVQTGAYSSLDEAKEQVVALKKAGFDAIVKDIATNKEVNIKAPVPETVADVPGTIWNFLKSKGLNDYAIAGIMGNLCAESALNSQNLQQTFESKLGYTDATYTAAVDNGNYDNFVRDSAGYGLVQWTYWSRKQALLDYAKKAGKSIGSLSMQLDFMWSELQGYTSVMNTLKSATSVRQASDVVLTQYEKPADQSESVQEKRASYGDTYYNKYAEKKATTSTTSTNLKYKEGDIVKFKGNVHYSSANASVGVKVSSGKAKITSVYPTGKHPYHCRAVNDSGAFVGGVYGWVNAEDIEAITTAKKSITEIAKDVIRGLYGNGEARKKKLTEEGYDYSEVQKEVNRLCK